MEPTASLLPRCERFSHHSKTTMDTPVRPWLRAVYWTLARDDEAGLRTLLTTYRERVQLALPPPPPPSGAPEYGVGTAVPPPARLCAVEIRVRRSGSALVLGDDAAVQGRYAFELPVGAGAPLAAMEIGDTVLHLAARNGLAACTRMLLSTAAPATPSAR